jgi:hypothetical protein
MVNLVMSITRLIRSAIGGTMKRSFTLIALVVLCVSVISVPTKSAQAASYIQVDKSTLDVWGVHIAVVLYKDTATGQIHGFCSLSGNSGVRKTIKACHVRHGTPTANTTVATATAVSSTSNVSTKTNAVVPYPNISYAAYIGYELNNGHGSVFARTGRTDFILISTR